MIINEFALAGFIMAVGLSAAGAGTHLYQAIAQHEAELNYAGKTYISTLGTLLMSFVCGPYIMLQMGLRAPAGSRPTVLTVLLASFVAFGWAFFTGLLLVGVFLAVTGR